MICRYEVISTPTGIVFVLEYARDELFNHIVANCKSRKLVNFSTKSFRASSSRRRKIEEGVVNDLVNRVLGVNKEEIWECLRRDDGPQGKRSRLLICC